MESVHVLTVLIRGQLALEWAALESGMKTQPVTPQSGVDRWGKAAKSTEPPPASTRRGSLRRSSLLDESRAGGTST